MYVFHTALSSKYALCFPVYSIEIIENILYSRPSPWVIFLKLLLSPDIEKNPGDLRNGFFNFCCWNLNSLVKENFSRARLLERQNVGTPL